MHLSVILLFIFMLLRSSLANLDLYLPKEEVYKLFGIENAELYYIFDGEINHNALKFVARVQPEHHTLKYKWQSTSPNVQIAYDINFEFPSNSSQNKSSGRTMIHTLQTNISTSGFVPKAVGMFEVYVNCTGTSHGNVTFDTELSLHISPPQNSRKIKIRRLKKCNKVDIEQKKPADVPHSDDNIYHNPTDISIPGSGIQQSASAFYISIGSVALFIVIIFIVCCWWHVRMNKKHRGHGSDVLHPIQFGQYGNQFLRLDLPNNAQKQPSHSSLVQFTPFINDLGTDINEISGKLSDVAISRDSVTLGELVLEGTFARIFKGTLKDGTLALIKTVTNSATEEQKRLLLFESSLLRGMHHRNLLTLKNVVLDSDSTAPMVVFPFKEGCNLKHFLQSLKVNEAPSAVTGLFSSNLVKCSQVSTQELVEMALQIASGMTYISKRGVVHKDLASRNCVIDNDLKIKITDYALSRDAFPGDYCCLGNNENRPVRWLALESLVHKMYTSASDVWSFGVLLWELQSLAAMPYVEIDDFEMADYLSDGFRLSQPINCPDHMYNIMAGCWHYSADQRPAFTQLLQLLTEFYAELSDYV